MNERIAIRKPLSILFATLLMSWWSLSVADAGQIRKIVHPDGRVEYTNLNDKQRSVHYTNSQKSSSKSVYKFRNDDGVLSFTDQKPVDFAFEVIRFDCFACRVGSSVNWQTTPLNLKAYRDTVISAAEKYGVDSALIRAVIHAESAFKERAVSRAGAQGLMQLMPATAKDLGVTDSFNPVQNINGGAKYLAALLANFSGDIRLATAAYNAGPGAVSRYNGIPPYAETQAYVERVSILKDRYAKAN